MPKASNNPIEQAVKLLHRGENQEAADLLVDYLQKSPDSLEGWYNLGYAYMELDRIEDAVKAFDEALAIDNQIFEIWFNKANALYDLADFKAAKECYEKALEIDPDDPEAWNNLGNCYSRLAEGQKALEAYTRAVALDSNYAEAFYNKANCHFIEEDDERAVAYAELAVQLKPQLAERVSQWIDVARDRLAAKRNEEERRKRAPKLEKSLERDRSKDSSDAD